MKEIRRNHGWIEGGAILRLGVGIGDRTAVGPGSMVVRDAPEGVITAGNPGKVIRSALNSRARRVRPPGTMMTGTSESLYLGLMEPSGSLADHVLAGIWVVAP